jgi:membrane-bound serine protease (ClpP class)
MYKKIFFPILLTLINFLGYSANDSLETLKEKKEIEKTKVYVFDIKDQIAAPTQRITTRAISEAEKLGADFIILRMNTYGGAVDAADSIRTRILNCKIPVYVLIENNAASAGALISLACDSIYMQPGSTIGAATVVDQSGQQVPDKYQSYMRKKMRATAESNGRNPDIAEAMVDPDVEVEGISEKGKVVTFTTTEALKHGFCDAVLDDVSDILKRQMIEDYEITYYEQNLTEKIIGIMINPAVSGVLILIIIGGIYFELQTPGVGFPILASLIAATLYFTPLYLEGLAENWEIILFITGIILLAVEIFVIPGFGVAGVLGITAMVVGLTLSMVENVGFDFTYTSPDAVPKALTTVILAILSLIIAMFLFGKNIIETSFFRRLVLQSNQNKSEGYVGADITEFSFVGKTGITATPLRPAGKIEIENSIHDASSDGEFIEKGENIIVTKFHGTVLMVKKVKK